MNSSLHIYPNAQILVQKLTDVLKELIGRTNKNKKGIFIALSGGNTPRLWFDNLTAEKDRIEWSRLHVFWGDERCVPPDHPDSNYGLTKKYLLDNINIPAQNIYRIRGEDNPEMETIRYSDEIAAALDRSGTGWPVFDWIILGLGTDGHVASLFPGSRNLQRSDSICVTAEHPQTGQKRISLSLPVINQARRISFLVSGAAKAGIVAKIHGRGSESGHLPAAMVNPEQGMIEWFLDTAAASQIEKNI